MMLVVEAVIAFGSGVAGLSVLTHMHTPPQRLTSQRRRNLHAVSNFWDLMILLLIPHADIFLAPRVAKHPGTAISRPPGSCSPSRTSNCLLIVFTHMNFLVSPTQFFLRGFENGVASSSTHGRICGFGIVIVHAPMGRL